MQVEKTLFRVHSYLFVKDSIYMQGIIAQHCASVAAGSAYATQPIRLEEDVKVVDFERLLSIIYPE
jgi:hypothetical protein